MVHGGGLSPREISAVLSQFSIGEVESIRPLLAGSTQAPKARVTTDSGVFLLKRLAPSRSDLEGMRFQHRILRHLTIAGFPVAELQISNDNVTMVSHDAHYYELCRWVEGKRYQFQIAAAKACGAAMAAIATAVVSSSRASGRIICFFRSPPREGMASWQRGTGSGRSGCGRVSGTEVVLAEWRLVGTGREWPWR